VFCIKNEFLSQKNLMFDFPVTVEAEILAKHTTRRLFFSQNNRVDDMLSTLGAVKKRAQSCGSWWNGPSGLDWLARPNNAWPLFFPNFFISINAYFLFFKKLNYIYINTSSLFYLFFRETLLNDRDFLVMCLIFEEIFPIHLWSFFLIFCIDEIYF